MMDWVWSLLWGAMPTWAWVVISGVVLGAAWRTFGWQGLVGGLAALLTLGAYRQGWRDRDQDKPPLVPVEDYEREAGGAQPHRPNKPRRNIWSLQDILRGRND